MNRTRRLQAIPVGRGRASVTGYCIIYIYDAVPVSPPPLPLALPGKVGGPPPHLTPPLEEGGKYVPPGPKAEDT